MAPEGVRVRRRDLRRAGRGIPTGRRATHAVETAYGRKRKARDWAAAWDRAIAAAAGED